MQFNGYNTTVTQRIATQHNATEQTQRNGLQHNAMQHNIPGAMDYNTTHRNTTDHNRTEPNKCNTTQHNLPQHSKTGNENHAHMLNKPVEVTSSSTKNSTEKKNGQKNAAGISILVLY